MSQVKISPGEDLFLLFYFCGCLKSLCTVTCCLEFFVDISPSCLIILFNLCSYRIPVCKFFQLLKLNFNIKMHKYFQI